MPKWGIVGVGQVSAAPPTAAMEGRVTRPAVWNGHAVLVTLSDESATGFLNVLKLPGNRKKPYYAKFQPVGDEMVIFKNDTSVRVAPIPYCIFV